jgi:hypothetical protein
MAKERLPGVRIGPLDPDRAEAFGSVAAGAQTARQLIRHHVAMHPPALVAALTRKQNTVRSAALDRDEAEQAIRAHYAEMGEELPEDAKIAGFNVHGEEDAPEHMVLGFVYVLPSGRSGKGFIPYDDESLPESIAAGHDAVAIDELKRSGLPWEPKAQTLAAGDSFARQVAGRRQRRGAAEAEDADDGEGAETPPADVVRERDELAARVEELEKRLAEVEASPPDPPQPDAENTGDAATPPVSDSGVTSSPQNAEGGSGDLPPAERTGGSGDGEGDGPPVPFEGYDEEKAPDLRRRISESDDRAEVEKILAYERANQGRATVVAAAEQRLDRSGSSS